MCVSVCIYVCIYIYAGGILPDCSYTYLWYPFHDRLIACVRDHMKAFLQRRVPLGHASARDRLVRAGPVACLVGVEVLCRNAADFWGGLPWEKKTEPTELTNYENVRLCPIKTCVPTTTIGGATSRDFTKHERFHLHFGGPMKIQLHGYLNQVLVKLLSYYWAHKRLAISCCESVKASILGWF